MALRQLRDEDSLKFGSILALLRKPTEASDAYLAMVEENEIRVGLSYFERARIAAKAVEHGVYSSEKAALLTLYHAASRAKRSKIRSFLAVVQALDGHLQFPSALGERLGLVLAKAIEDDSDITQRLRVALQQADITSAEEEQAVLQAALVFRGEAEGRAIKTVTKSPLDTIPSDSKIVVTEQDDGSLTLSGGGVTRALRPALEAWLQGWNKS
jgi:hypothetical protein